MTKPRDRNIASEILAERHSYCLIFLCLPSDPHELIPRCAAVAAHVQMFVGRGEAEHSGRRSQEDDQVEGAEGEGAGRGLHLGLVIIQLCIFIRLLHHYAIG